MKMSAFGVWFCCLVFVKETGGYHQSSYFNFGLIGYNPTGMYCILRLHGGVDYSQWEKIPSEDDPPEENAFSKSVVDHMDILQNHAGSMDECAKDDDGLDEAEDDQDADWLCDLGEMERSTGYIDRAERTFQRALQINRTHVQTMVCYGKLLIEKQEHAQAEGFFATALRLDPDNADARSELQKLCSNGEDELSEDAETQVRPVRSWRSR